MPLDSLIKPDLISVVGPSNLYFPMKSARLSFASRWGVHDRGSAAIPYLCSISIVTGSSAPRDGSPGLSGETPVGFGGMIDCLGSIHLNNLKWMMRCERAVKQKNAEGAGGAKYDIK